MSLTDTNGNGMIMPVAPMYNGGYGMNNSGFGSGWGGDGAWWLLVLFLFMFNGNWNNGGWGNNANGAIPYIMNNTTNNDVQRGFDQQAIMTNLGDINSAVTSGFSGVNQSLCNGFAGVNQNLCSGFAGVNSNINQGISSINSNINNGFSSAEIANNSRQMANMQQQFNTQTAITGSLTGLQSQLAQCCCDNRLATANLNSTILSENCADRAALSDGVRDIVTNQTANTQSLLNTINSGIQSIQDKLCQQEIDALKAQNANLQNQITAQNIRAEGLANRAAILADNSAQTQALEQYLNPAPIPAYIVQNPSCCNNGYYNGCGCSA